MQKCLDTLNEANHVEYGTGQCRKHPSLQCFSEQNHEKERESIIGLLYFKQIITVFLCLFPYYYRGNIPKSEINTRISMQLRSNGVQQSCIVQQRCFFFFTFYSLWFFTCNLQVQSAYCCSDTNLCLDYFYFCLVSFHKRHVYKV